MYDVYAFRRLAELRTATRHGCTLNLMKACYLFLMTLVALTPACLAQNPANSLVLQPLPETSPPNSKSQLRQQLLASYKKSKDAKVTPEKRLAMLTGIVRQSIRPGMRLDDAEQLLKDAGFRINDDPTHFPPREGGRLGRAVATLNIENANYGIVNLTISLEPTNLGEELSKVGEVKVFLGATSL